MIRDMVLLNFKLPECSLIYNFLIRTKINNLSNITPYHPSLYTGTKGQTTNAHLYYIISMERPAPASQIL